MTPMKKGACLGIFFIFLINTFNPGGSMLWAQVEVSLPPAGVRISLSTEYNPPILKGIKVHPDNPFQFDFVLLQSEKTLSKEEAAKLIKYFLASLTIPEKDLWVNLSPYEKDRIVPQSFGQTEMGRDLLAQDYILKQITASLIYPEDEIGKRFWKRIYAEASRKFGVTNIPVNTFNRVWIIPQKAVVFENAKSSTAYVVESKLKVMLEEDYLSLEKHGEITNSEASLLSKKVLQEIIIPALTIEVNTGRNFAQLRQVYSSLILATWYKKKIKDSILSRVYADKSKIAGVSAGDPTEKNKIYAQYLNAFKKGAYNYIKEEQDPLSKQIVPRKYFSGGFNMAMVSNDLLQVSVDSVIVPSVMKAKSRDFLIKVKLDTLTSASRASNDAAMDARVKDFSVMRIPQRGKSAMDLVLGTSLMLIFFILATLVAFAIKMDSPGPAIYASVRKGLNGQPFIIYKFRTMKIGADKELADMVQKGDMDLKNLSMKNDPRVTRIGGFLRKYKVDELPQLLNVLKGNMSLVGPRPMIDSASAEIDDNHHRWLVLPGMTGWAQLKGPQSNHKEIFDEHYVDNWSIWLDIKILYLTISHVILHKADAAMMGDDKQVGGIDLTSTMKVVTSARSQSEGSLGKEKEAIKFRLDSAQLQELENAPGFAPVIISINPMTNIRTFLGLNSGKN